MPDLPADQRRPGSAAASEVHDARQADANVGLPVFPDDDEWVPPPEPSDTELAGWPDPGTSPPDGEDAWLADLAAPQLDALAAELAAARPTVKEPVWAGFTHRLAAAAIAGGQPGWEAEPAAPARAGPARGFAAGGPLDLAEPGLVLAGFAQEVVERGLTTLSDDQLVGLLCAARRLTSWQAATELRAAAELASRRKRAAAAGRFPAGAEIANTTSGPSGSSEVGEHVAAELAAALTLTGRAADDLLGLALRLAGIRPVMAALSTGLIDLPKARVFAAELSAIGDVAANRIALGVLDHAPGWTTSQLRRALRAAVLATDPAAGKRRASAARDDARVETWQEGSGNAALSGRELPAAETIAADARISEIARALKKRGASGTMDRLRAGVYLALLLGKDPFERAPDSASGAGQAGDPCRPGGAARGLGLDGVINLTLPALTWLGLADRPGELAGLGPLDPFTCRDLSRMLAARGTASWHVTLTDTAGRAVAHACARGQPTATGPPGGTEPRIRWLAGLRFDWMERGECGHNRQVASYQPGRALRHLLTTRNPTCAAPGCRWPASRCDNEHTIPFDAGGRTCECNCAPVCRRHHRIKQAAGWHLAQPSPGVLVWTTPAGRSYLTRPGSYPV